MTKSESGVASSHALTITLSLLTFAFILFLGIQFWSLHQRASQGADFAALAASKEAVAGGQACDVAREIAEANKVTLVACRIDVEVATVTTRAELATSLGTWGVKSRARAAPDFYFAD